VGADSSDTERDPSGRDSSDPPGAVSNQNQEEAEGGHAGAGGGEPSTDGARGDSGNGAPDESSDSVPGAASEGSQATGHPENAG
jgi:hypothetical protein